ncbi:hypothetical protein ACHGLA_03815 [Streptomyces sp. YH02]|uniref:hypothetical protein n=1 Tax=Streptomyces sp. YH02 TaxID=3256999 RepID=UPI0037578832
MRSETRTAVPARVRDKLGEVLTASMSVLFVEAVIGALGLAVWGETQESTARPTYHPMGIFLLIVVAPFGAALGAVLSFGLVMPLLVGAGWVGRRASGRGAWWWVPALAAAGTVVPVLVVSMVAEAGLSAAVCGWLMVTTALSVPALVARRVLLPDRPRLSVKAVFGWVALYGTLAVVTAATLAGSALSAGIGYEPPRLSAERVAGTWSDGRGGTLTLSADGKATTTRIETFELGESFEVEVRECTGAGTWTYDTGTAPGSQRVTVSVGGCTMDDWLVSGSAEHPKLYVTYGDPDDGTYYALVRRDQGSGSPAS